MKDVHLVVGVLAISLNAVACLYGAWCWRRAEPSTLFWRLLRSAQIVVVVQVALGGALVLEGHKPPGLHVLYGVLPLLVSLIAEQLRAASAQMVLDQRGLQSADVGKLPDDDQRSLVRAILQREMAVMVLAALVIVVVLARAAATH